MATIKAYTDKPKRKSYFKHNVVYCKKGDVVTTYPNVLVAEKETGVYSDRIYKCCNGKMGYAECLAWLEKQGEHSNFLSKIQVGDKVTRNEDGVLVNLSQLKRIAKPAEEHNITGIGSKSAQGKLGEMIKNLKPVNEVLEQGFAWSEEDEKQARQIERIVHDDGCTQKLQKQIANWLKSLKDRYTWKPSDEQMNTLEYYMHTLVCNEHKEILFGLYSCLKKLREE